MNDHNTSVNGEDGDESGNNHPTDLTGSTTRSHAIQEVQEVETKIPRPEPTIINVVSPESPVRKPRKSEPMATASSEKASSHLLPRSPHLGASFDCSVFPQTMGPICVKKFVGQYLGADTFDDNFKWNLMEIVRVTFGQNIENEYNLSLARHFYMQHYDQCRRDRLILLKKIVRALLYYSSPEWRKMKYWDQLEEGVFDIMNFNELLILASDLDRSLSNDPANVYSRSLEVFLQGLQELSTLYSYVAEFCMLFKRLLKGPQAELMCLIIDDKKECTKAELKRVFSLHRNHRKAKKMVKRLLRRIEVCRNMQQMRETLTERITFQADTVKVGNIWLNLRSQFEDAMSLHQAFRSHYKLIEKKYVPVRNIFGNDMKFFNSQMTLWEKKMQKIQFEDEDWAGEDEATGLSEFDSYDIVYADRCRQLFKFKDIGAYTVLSYRICPRCECLCLKNADRDKCTQCLNPECLEKTKDWSNGWFCHFCLKVATKMSTLRNRVFNYHDLPCGNGWKVCYCEEDKKAGNPEPTSLEQFEYPVQTRYNWHEWFVGYGDVPGYYEPEMEENTPTAPTKKPKLKKKKKRRFLARVWEVVGGGSKGKKKIDEEEYWYSDSESDE